MKAVKRPVSLLLGKPQIRRRHRFREPHAVLRPIERMPIAVHPPGLDHQHHRPAAALAHAGGRFTVRRQMNVMPIAAHKALLADRVQKSLHRAVIEQFGRFDGREAQIHLDAVPLVGPDEPAVRREGEPLLVVRGDNFFQLLPRDRLPVTGGAAKRSLTATQPSASSVMPIAWGLWRSTKLRNLLISTNCLLMFPSPVLPSEPQQPLVFASRRSPAERRRDGVPRRGRRLR